MQGLIETFWLIIVALFGALAIGALMVGGVILALGCAVLGCGWFYLRRVRKPPR